MKKAICMLLAVVMIVAMSIPVMADNYTREITSIVNDDLYAIAYTVIDEQTTNVQKERILAAREEIIYSQSWVADGLSGRILDCNGNVKRSLPQFSELFPEDWDLPVDEETQKPLNGMMGYSSSVMSNLPEFDISHSFQGEVKLSAPSLPLTPPFCSFVTTGFPGLNNEYYVETVYTEGIFMNLQEVGTFNVGYTNVTTGESLAFATYLDNGDVFQFDPPESITLGVRASTYDRPGKWTMSVVTKRVFVNA